MILHRLDVPAEQPMAACDARAPRAGASQVRRAARSAVSGRRGSQRGRHHERVLANHHALLPAGASPYPQIRAYLQQRMGTRDGIGAPCKEATRDGSDAGLKTQPQRAVGFSRSPGTLMPASDRPPVLSFGSFLELDPSPRPLVATFRVINGWQHRTALRCIASVTRKRLQRPPRRRLESLGQPVSGIWATEWAETRQVQVVAARDQTCCIAVPPRTPVDRLNPGRECGFFHRRSSCLETRRSLEFGAISQGQFFKPDRSRAAPE